MPKVDADNSLQDLHNAPINVNFELGSGGGKLFFDQMPQGHHIWWKENKFPTPPITVRLQVKCVSL